MTRLLAACFVLIAIGSCAVRDTLAAEPPATSPAQEARDQQLRDAQDYARTLPPMQIPACKWLNEHTCVSLDEWVRMQTKTRAPGRLSGAGESLRQRVQRPGTLLREPEEVYPRTWGDDAVAGHPAPHGAITDAEVARQCRLPLRAVQRQPAVDE